MKALVLADDRWHPGDIPHRGLAGLGDFDWIENGRDWSAERMVDYPVVILAKANHENSGDPTPWADDGVGLAFKEFVEGGGGLLVIHSGTSGYGEIRPMRELVAGAFDHHPEPSPVTVEPVAGHPICAGVEAFTEMDEHYFMHFDDMAAEVFLHSRSEHGVQPAGWMRKAGRGRVCVITPGHNLAMWLQPGFQRLLKNALAWTGGTAGVISPADAL